MEMSYYSIINSMIFFSLFLFLIVIFRRSNRFILKTNIFSLTFLSFICIIRLALNIEFYDSIVIKSEVIIPFIRDFLLSPIFNFEYLTYGRLLVLIWIMGSLFNFLKSVEGYRYLLSALEESENVDERTEKIFKELLKEKRINKNIEIYSLSSINSPMTVGLLNPKIYLPCIKFEDLELRLVLLHELNHILSRDLYKKIFMQFLKIVFWWNPLIYIFTREYNIILELQCDDRVLSHADNATKDIYLNSIMKVLSYSLNKKSMVQQNVVLNFASSTNANMVQRFKIIKSPKEVKKSLNYLFYVFTISIFLISYLFVSHPFYYPPDAENLIEGEEITFTNSKELDKYLENLDKEIRE